MCRWKFPIYALSQFLSIYLIYATHKRYPNCPLIPPIIVCNCVVHFCTAISIVCYRYTFTCKMKRWMSDVIFELHYEKQVKCDKFREIEDVEYVLRKHVEKFVEELVDKNNDKIYISCDINGCFNNIFSKQGLRLACFQQKWKQFNFYERYQQEKESIINGSTLENDI